jgi:phytanoyl-CoA hydroxylase
MTDRVERRLHPWNRGFEWQPPRGPFTTITDQQAASYDEHGYFVLEDAFDAATLAELDAALAPGDEKVHELLAAVPGGRFSVAGLDTQTVAPHAVQRSDFARDFCARPVLAGLCRDLVGPRTRLYWEQSVYKQPHSAEPVLWHQDNGYTYVEPQSYLTCWIAITDATPDNGCIAVMPGVHREGTLAHRQTDLGQECWGDWNACVSVPVRAGSIVVFTSLTPHATFVNTTDDVRKAYIVQYAPDGAETLEGDPDAGPPTKRVRQDDESRQFLVT